MSTLTWAVAAVLTDEAGRVLLCRAGGPSRRWGLPGGRPRRSECPIGAVTGEILAETGWRVEVTDLVGIYHLSGAPCGRAAPGPGPLPDVLVHVFRARPAQRPAGNAPAGCALGWHRPDQLPEEVTPVTRAAVADASAGRSGVLRDLRPAGMPEPAPPPAADGSALPTPGGATVPPGPRAAPVPRPHP
ncbi:NUDIX hydrolase [Micromonospora sp. CPCC 206171]|uniref:NUDIX hydrolase n=1 Tax=Micromonospora sp. CPCC 206171 TaxID=3122405 RepID=UPI002FF3A1FE